MQYAVMRKTSGVQKKNMDIERRMCYNTLNCNLDLYANWASCMK